MPYARAHSRVVGRDAVERVPAAKGIVYLVGAGPGDADLFTLRGVELLGRADVVIYDGLVNRELLRFAPPTAEIIYGGKHDRTRCVSQAELNALMLAKAREGHRIVRLKGGDPFIFGRGGEEAEVLAAASIPFEVVPGISSVHSVPCYASIPLTHRDYACCAVEPETEDRTGGGAALVERGADWIIFASGLTIEHFHHRIDLPGFMARFPGTRLAIASQSIRSALEKLGLAPAAIAQPDDVPGLVNLISGS